MINVVYADKFIKDLKNLKSTPYYQCLREFCFEEIPALNTTQEVFAINHIKKLEGHTNYYRFRIGDYRVGVEIIVEEETIRILRVLHRSKIYDFFPNL
jgi:mRNA interferase RelE/StbE